jgi:hypothetical protein
MCSLLAGVGEGERGMGVGMMGVKYERERGSLRKRGQKVKKGRFIVRWLEVHERNRKRQRQYGVRLVR